jgi:glycosyltransferase involved in cell wall biosynthesis
VARFSPEKNLGRLIRDFQVSKLAKTHRLRLIGGGPQRAELEKLILDPERVELRDWLTYTELPAAYARARFFILPSLFEPWGLVVNEAMAAGLPVVVSRACGCQPDLVTPANGFVFDENDPESLPEILDQLVDLEEDQRLEMGQASRRIIAEFSCLTWAQQLERSFD